MRAPFASYCSSVNWLPAPAPFSTTTSCPCCTSSRAPAGVSATRYSCGLISLATPILTRRTLHSGVVESAAGTCHAGDGIARRETAMTRRTTVLSLLASLLFAPLAARGERTTVPAHAVVKVAFNKKLKKSILVDSRGFTLYMYTARFRRQLRLCQRRDVPLLEGVAAAADQGRAPCRRGREGIAARDAEARRGHPGPVQGAPALHGCGRSELRPGRGQEAGRRQRAALPRDLVGPLACGDADPGPRLAGQSLDVGALLRPEPRRLACRRVLGRRARASTSPG